MHALAEEQVLVNSYKTIRGFLWNSYFKSYNNQQEGYYYLSYFIDEKIKTQGGQMSFPGSES